VNHAKDGDVPGGWLTKMSAVSRNVFWPIIHGYRETDQLNKIFMLMRAQENQQLHYIFH